MEKRVKGLLEDSTAPVWHLVSRDEVKTMLAATSQWPWYGQLMRRPQTMAYLCQIDFWLRHNNVAFCF